MGIELYLVAVVFVLTIVSLIRFQSRPTLVFCCSALVLYLSDIVSSEELIANASNIGILTLVLILINSFVLEKTRFLRTVSSEILKGNFSHTWWKLFFVSSVSSSMLNNTAVVAAMIRPLRNNKVHPASKLLLPLSYAAILGGTLTLIGTSTNLLVSSMYQQIEGTPIGFFEFTPIGIVAMLLCGLVMFLMANTLPSNDLKEDDYKQYTIEANVTVGSALSGKSVDKNGLRQLESLFLVEILRDQQIISPVTPETIINEGDHLIFSGDIKKVRQLEQFAGLSIFARENGLPLKNLTEVIIKPESSLIGSTMKKQGFRARFDAAVVALKRDGEDVSGKLGEIALKAGDTLVLAIGKDFASRQNIGNNFIVMSGTAPDTVLTRKKEVTSIILFLVAIIIAAIGIVPLFKVMLILLSYNILSGNLSIQEIRRYFPYRLWLIITSALTLSTAMQNSGLISEFEWLLRDSALVAGPLSALILVYIATWVLTELVTNNAAAALIFPIGHSLADIVHIDPKAFALTVAFAASASFISPYGYQTNLMVYSAGGYRLMDFLRFGALTSIVYFIAVMTVIASIFLL
ncbi:SLC13 family permease [Enterovibrio calviensis]|uniref:SLC13 family permease n=1 Tax=Enterovibrio calviensis TaxID=91359 RepID=UPI000488E2E3|nr:SLC13 family permease [Enterovibrio calviensis]